MSWPHCGARVGARAIELIASSPLPTELVLTTVVNELAAAPADVWLDDYQLVDSRDLRDGMVFSLERTWKGNNFTVSS